jgi:acyl-homoserine lactone acylase PvdQ
MVRVRVIGLVLAAGAFVLPAQAAAASPPPLPGHTYGHFRSVLAQGEGQTVNAVDLAQYELTGDPPDSFVSQQPLYAGIMPAARTLSASDLDTYYKDTDFGTMPGGTASLEEPLAGVHIYRDAQFGMAHIYGDTRYDAMFGAGYATAEERLFLMDALRRTAKGTLAGLLGASAAGDDASQLTDQDFSDAELTKQFNSLPKHFGAAGARGHADLLAYVDGINARIQHDLTVPTDLPAEYPALGATPEPWEISDSAAMAVLLVTQFTVSNGSEQTAAMLQQAFRKSLGKGWFRTYHDLRETQDPEAFVVAKRPFRSDDPGPVDPALNVRPNFGSIQGRNAIVTGPAPKTAKAAKAGVPAWVRSVENLKRSLPPVESNAVMVTRGLSSNGHALAAMGPQVGYYSPQIFSEYELHGGGIDAEGVSFPGASPYPLIGHGIDSPSAGRAQTATTRTRSSRGSATQTAAVPPRHQRTTSTTDTAARS